ncbi:lipopolysaccharide export system permease protein [Hoeflea marina]|uniref:Lipopolysaccharide export system permease protein n=1 Tax=Hoeflea marina TaxID=274592 RepID=A0A317PND8_9HYPH|nr:LPS export ABC transporter permease LptG [Hoeflea marina]PWW02287.1 lipopolysaccharide export system permease protein [Hoeflea marina]
MRLYPGVVWRYFFRRYVVTLLAYSAAILFIILLVDFNESSRRISASENYTIAIGIYLSALRLPMVMQTALPFVALIASIVTLTQLNRKYELVVVRAAGISAWQFLAPLIVANLLLGLFSIMVLNPLSANSTSLAESMMLEQGLGSTRKGADKTVPWLRQRTEQGDTVIGARESADGGTRLGNVTFFRFDSDNHLRDRLEAKSVVLAEGEWQLTDIIRFRANEKPERIDSLAILTNLQAEFLGESLASPDSVSFFDLPSKIAAAQSYGMPANAYAMQLHRLIAQPALLAAMTLIAAVVSLKFVRFGQSLSVVLGGILAGFVLYVVSDLIQSFGNAGTIPPFVAAWLPVLVASALGTTILLHKEDG